MSGLTLENFESVDGTRRDPDLDGVLYIEDDADSIFNEPDWTLQELQPSISDNGSLNPWSSLGEVKTACAADGIGF